MLAALDRLPPAELSTMLSTCPNQRVHRPPICCQGRRPASCSRRHLSSEAPDCCRPCPSSRCSSVLIDSNEILHIARPANRPGHSFALPQQSTAAGPFHYSASRKYPRFHRHPMHKAACPRVSMKGRNTAPPPT